MLARTRTSSVNLRSAVYVAPGPAPPPPDATPGGTDDVLLRAGTTTGGIRISGYIGNLKLAGG